jgi:phenylalanyl-tRNA synthetase beta chain
VRVSYRWLRELLPALELSPGDTAERLTRLGVLVDEIERADRGFERVLVGRVERVDPHPRADRLKVCAVADGAGVRTVVCGAPVVKPGAIYPLALPGAQLPNGVSLEASEIRGVRSEGMLCSAPELGLPHLGEAGGILELTAAGAGPGDAVAPILGLDDAVFVLDVPANRPDWESHVGVARELAAAVGGDLRIPEPETLAWLDEREGSAARLSRGGAAPEPAGDRDAAGEARVRIVVEDADGCPLYTARVIEGVRMGPSPLAVRQRLWMLGVRPLLNVVDATNWVLLELGTPTHAFDLARIAGPEIRVRRGVPGETLVTLDGRTRRLDPAITVIADPERAVAVGGVMGGVETEVSETSSAVLLEAAFFDPARIRGAAARLEMRTEASHRFARGVDRTAVPRGLRRATELVLAWAGGRTRGPALSVGTLDAPPATVRLRPARAAALTGLDLDAAAVGSALAETGLEVDPAPGGALAVRVPPHRYDLAREEDLIEEVARRVGYDRVPSTRLPARDEPLPRERAAAAAALAGRLRGAGFDEAYTTTFFDPEPFGPGFFPGRLLEQANPLAQDARHLRPTLVATLAGAARHNLRRGAAGVAFFEIGHVFEAASGVDAGGRAGPVGRADDRGRTGDRGRTDGGSPTRGDTLPPRDAAAPADTPARGDALPALPGVRERRAVAALLAGSPFGGDWSEGGKPRPADFWDAKGVVELALRGRPVAFRPSDLPWLHPGQQATVLEHGRPIGFVARLHPRVERALDLDAAAFVVELDLDAVLTAAPAARRVSAPPAFPRVERDVALLAPAERPAAELLERIRTADLAALVDVRIFDVYRGAQVPGGMRSLAFRLVFQRPDRTLTEAEVDGALEGLLADLAREGVTRR